MFLFCTIKILINDHISDHINNTKCLFESSLDFDAHHIFGAKAQASLHICTDSPEPFLLAYSKYGYRPFRTLSLLDTSILAFI